MQNISFENWKQDTNFKIKSQKFGEITKWTCSATNETFIKKSIVKNDKNALVIGVLKNEALFSFERPGLPTLIEFYEDSRTIILIRRFKPGLPLNEFWQSSKKGKNKVDLLQKFIRAFASVYKILEDELIVHCDIKPSNILIHEENNELFVEIIDFGMAIDLKKELPKRQTLFQLRFSAPELILNHIGLLNNQTDLFSFGLVLYYLLSPEDPFHHSNPSIRTNLQLTYPLPKNKKIPDQIFDTIFKASAKKSFGKPPNLMSHAEVQEILRNGRNARFQNMDQLLDVVNQWKITPKSWIKSLLLFGNRDLG